MMETWEECAIREVKEEMNIDIHRVRFGHVTNDIMANEGKHYVTIFMMAECVDPNAIPENMEPHKCLGWESYSWEDIAGRTEQLFGPLKQLVDDQPKAVLDFLAQ